MLERAYPDIDPGKVTVIYNGIDTEQYAPDPDTDVLQQYGVDPDRPSVVFVGRITRQKGVEQLLEAARGFAPEAQLVLCAGSADTPELGAEVERRVTDLQATRSGVIWLEQMLPKREVIQLLSHATVFACPSIYEPLGIVNLEAMACEAAVVASDTGGIPEVVVDGETGFLVSLGDGYAEEFAARVNELVADPGKARAMGRAGRERAVNDFAWGAIAEQTSALYRRLS
jgi:starch synthase